jgi:branched-chain amino acid transport system substrate-binding protein
MKQLKTQSAVNHRLSAIGYRPSAVPVLFVAALLIFCAGPGNKIKLGLIAPLTGDVKTFGESTRNGYTLAVDEANAAGGVNGKLIDPKIADDKNDPTECANAGSKLINQDGVKLIVGSVASKCSNPLSDLCQSSKVVMISTASTNPMVTVTEKGMRKDYVFRACFIDPFQGAVGARFALDNLKAKSAAVLYDVGNDYSKGLAEYFKNTFTQGGGTIVLYKSYAKDDVDFSSLLTDVKQVNPEVLFLPDYYQKVGLIAMKARELSIPAKLLGGDGWDSPDMVKIAGDAINGGYFTNHFSPDDQRPEVQDFVKKYKAKYGAAPDALATLAYDATRIMLEAIRRAGTDKPDAVRDAMAKITDFPTVSGKISFDKNGNPLKSAVVLQYQDGQQKYVATVNP